MTEHTLKMLEEPDMLDTAKCSCGWKSKVYYDGREFAYNDWKRHVAVASALSPAERGAPT